MRTAIFLLPLLAGTAAIPASASPDGDDRRQARAERSEAREAARAERSEARSEGRSERSEARSERAMRVEASEFESGLARSRATAAAPQAELDQIDAARAQRIEQRSERIEQRSEGLQQRQEMLQDLRESRALRQSDRPLPRILQNPVPVVSNTPRAGTQPPAPVVQRSSPAPSWSSSWRHDRRYDWYNWRKRNRWLFHLGFYYDPYGWNYYPYQIGWRLWPSYYGSRYWLNDPWRYRLPYAPPGYRWIRYWDDAVLVDTWTGEVVDVIHNFFW